MLKGIPGWLFLIYLKWDLENREKIEYLYQYLLMEYQDKVSHSKYIMIFKNKPELNWSWVQAETVRLQIICFQDKCCLNKWHFESWISLKRITRTYILNLVKSKCGPIIVVIALFLMVNFLGALMIKNFAKPLVDFTATSQLGLNLQAGTAV